MSYFSLLLSAEQNFAAYLSANLSTSYQKTTPDGPVVAQYGVSRAFTADTFSLPLVLVKADGKFTELEPNTHIYRGTLQFLVFTQIDDVEDPLAAHDATVSQLYDLLADPETVTANVEGETFHLWGFYRSGYEQDIYTVDGARAFRSTLEFTIDAQTLPVV